MFLNKHLSNFQLFFLLVTFILKRALIYHVVTISLPLYVSLSLCLLRYFLSSFNICRITIDTLEMNHKIWVFSCRRFLLHTLISFRRLFAFLLQCNLNERQYDGVYIHYCWTLSSLSSSSSSPFSLLFVNSDGSICIQHIGLDLRTSSICTSVWPSVRL